MNARLTTLLASLALGAFALTASAEPVRTIDAPRIRLADIAEGTADLGELDLGPAPPPGSSRIFVRDDVLRELRSQGLDPRAVKLPTLIRVQSMSRRFTPNELSAMVREQVVAVLPPAVRLEQLSINRGLVASPKIAVGTVRVPKLPKRVGATTITAIADLMHDDQIVARLPITLKLDVSEDAVKPLVDRGARIELVIARGAAKISASAIALEPTEIGQIASFKVSTTQKVLRARLQSSTQALVVTP